mgnify:FL=1
MVEKDHISNLIWIVAIVILLTFLIVVISWMSSGKLKVENTEESSKTTEMNVEPKDFLPESKAPPLERDVESEVPPAQKEEKITSNSKTLEETKLTENKKSDMEPQPVILTNKEIEIKEKSSKEKKETEQKGTFALQVGAFSALENAKSFEKKLSSKGYKTATKEKGNLTVVMIVGISSQQEATRLKEKLAKENIQSSVVPYP